VGFTNVSARTILDSLISKFGCVTPSDMEINRKLLETPFNVEDGLEPRWNMANEVQQFATLNNQPIQASVIIQ
jgi:hypothetical protein